MIRIFSNKPKDKYDTSYLYIIKHQNNILGLESEELTVVLINSKHK